MERLGIKAMLGIPLLLGSKIVGSFTIRFPDPRELSAEELELTLKTYLYRLSYCLGRRAKAFR